jgi:hypothetical protein
MATALLIMMFMRSEKKGQNKRECFLVGFKKVIDIVQIKLFFHPKKFSLSSSRLFDLKSLFALFVLHSSDHNCLWWLQQASSHKKEEEKEAKKFIT